MDLEPAVFVLYVLPGIISVAIKNIVVPEKPRSDLNQLAQAFLFSALSIALVYAAVWIIGLVQLPKSPLAVTGSNPPWGLVIGEFILSPFVGIGWAKFLGSQLRRHLIKRCLGIDAGQYENTWPQFCSQVRGHWVLVRLTQGIVYGGYPAEYDHRGWEDTDLVLGHAVRIGPNGETLGRVPGDRVYIRLSQVASIEAWEPIDEDNHQTQGCRVSG